MRKYIQEVFKEDTEFPELLKDNEDVRKECLLKEGDWKAHLPMRIGDYTDFFAGINHAKNAGTMFRVSCLGALFARLFGRVITSCEGGR